MVLIRIKRFTVRNRDETQRNVTEDRVSTKICWVNDLTREGVSVLCRGAVGILHSLVGTTGVRRLLAGGFVDEFSVEEVVLASTKILPVIEIFAMKPCTHRPIIIEFEPSHGV